jgi:hypothetical protein
VWKEPKAAAPVPSQQNARQAAIGAESSEGRPATARRRRAQAAGASWRAAAPHGVRQDGAEAEPRL